MEIESDRFIPCELNLTPTIHHRIALYGTGQFSGRRYRRDTHIIVHIRVVSVSFYYIILYYIILYYILYTVTDNSYDMAVMFAKER
jgi:hypothetical protein